jgi:putative MATE family efflux protein
MDQVNTTSRLGTAPITPLLFRLAAPSVAGMAIQALYNVVDTIYVGHVSKEALAALSLAFPVQMVLIAIAVGTGVGTSSLISRLLGEGREGKADMVATNVVVVIFVYSAVFAFLGFFFSKTVVGVFTDDPLLIELSSSYLRIVVTGSLAMFFPMITNNILRGEGNTFLPMITLLIGAVINIILDPFLIFGIGPFPRMEVEGAGLATVIARLISGVYIALILLKGQNQIRLRFARFRPDFSLLKEVYRVGFPAMMMQLLASVMLAGINRIVVGYSAVALAVAGIFFRLQSFVLMPIFGLNQGYIPVVGYNYGHGNPKRMKHAIKVGLLLGSAFGLGGFLLFFLLPGPLIRMFNDDPELLKIGETALRTISFAFLAAGPAIVSSATFQALGKGFPSLVVGFIRQFVFLIPLMWLFGRIGGLDLLWISIPIANAVSLVLAALWLSLTLRKIVSKMG